MVVVCIFLFSGFSISPKKLRNGMMDVQGLLMALAIIFIAAPALAALFSQIPVDTGIIIGLFLISAMPSTLSSGVVMAAAAGGNAAHALVITIFSNCLSIFTIPYTLSILLGVIGQSATVTIDTSAIMLKIFLLVILPLTTGMFGKHLFSSPFDRLERKTNRINQILILFIVWVAMSQARGLVVNNGVTVAIVLVVVFTYHFLLLFSGWILLRFSGRKKGDRESIWIMGAQKTLPLAIILQMSLFPQYGIAFLVCVLHHIVHLMMDAYLVERLKTG